MISSGTFKTFAIAASLGAFVFSPCEALSAEIDTEFLKFKNSISQNWREYDFLSDASSAYTGNAEIKSVVGLASPVQLGDFNDEMNSFWSSLEDGSIFDDISVEVWTAAKRIVAANPDIVDHI